MQHLQEGTSSETRSIGSARLMLVFIWNQKSIRVSQVSGYIDLDSRPNCVSTLLSADGHFMILLAYTQAFTWFTLSPL